MKDLSEKLYLILLKMLQINSKQRLSLYEHKAFLVVLDVLNRLEGDFTHE